MDYRCYIVPPYLLKGMADSSALPQEACQRARAALELREKYTTARTQVLERLAQAGSANQPRSSYTWGITPPSLLSNLADSDGEAAKKTLEHELGRQRASEAKVQAQLAAEKKEVVRREVYDMENSQNELALPGKLARAEGGEAVEDKAVNEAFDNVGKVIKFFKDRFDWDSIDDRNMDVVSSVHFGVDYENAFWDPERGQMVFGDGDEFLNNFTASIDVIGHEMAHAVTEHRSPLRYWGQSGALNEHISDVFGIMIKQMAEDEKSDVADWLIGENCILPGVKGISLRSMKDPGGAFDDPRFGKDPQVGHMRDYKTMVEDNGGVHIFSGIPNKAFYLASVAFGGYSWEKAGAIWWKACEGRFSSNCTFIQFADITVDVAKEMFDTEVAKVVRKAWKDVGVERDV